MRAGSWFITAGMVLLAMSIALFSSLSREHRGPDIDLLSTTWKLACLPYSVQQQPIATHASAYACHLR